MDVESTEANTTHSCRRRRSRTQRKHSLWIVFHVRSLVRRLTRLLSMQKKRNGMVWLVEEVVGIRNQILSSNTNKINKIF